jgi:8-oxo-dGTP diphosphatase
VTSPVHVAAGVVLDSSERILLCRRPPGGRFSLRWEFPGGKVEPGEEAAAALERELREELGLECVAGRRLLEVEHRYEGGPWVRLEFFEVARWSGAPRGEGFHEVRWVERAELPAYDVLEADAPLVRLLAGEGEAAGGGV